MRLIIERNVLERRDFGSCFAATCATTLGERPRPPGATCPGCRAAERAAAEPAAAAGLARAGAHRKLELFTVFSWI